jgi:hypothetical protein
MAFTQQDIDALDTAYKSGAKSVTTSDGKNVQLHSVEEYMRLRNMMIAEVLGPSRSPASFSVARIRR